MKERMVPTVYFLRLLQLVVVEEVLSVHLMVEMAGQAAVRA